MALHDQQQRRKEIEKAFKQLAQKLNIRINSVNIDDYGGKLDKPPGGHLQEGAVKFRNY